MVAGVCQLNEYSVKRLPIAAERRTVRKAMLANKPDLTGSKLRQVKRGKESFATAYHAQKNNRSE
jgi:hypothetical protein